MTLFAVRAHGKRFVGASVAPQKCETFQVASQHGWRPWRFVRELADAEIFGSRAEADMFMRTQLARTDAFEVVDIGAPA